MTIHPVSFSAAGPSLLCDVCGWVGALALSDLHFAVRPDGSVDRTLLVVPCGNVACGSVSYHPVGGGAHPRLVQALFILKVMQAQGLTFAQAKALVKTAAETMDGLGRFKLDAVPDQSTLLTVAG